MKNNFGYKRFLVSDIKNSHENLLIRKKKLFEYDLHWHDCFEIELILNGTVLQHLNGEVCELSAGDIYLLNPTDFHSVSGNGAEAYNIMFSESLLSDELLKEILSVDHNIIFHLNEYEFQHTSMLIAQMIDEFEKSDGYSDIYIKNLLECLFILLLRKCNAEFDLKSSDEGNNIRKALLFMHSHFRENPSMADIAGISGFNKNYFSSLFHRTTGKTYKEYLSTLKLEYSKKLVLSGNLPITEICFASGFNSMSNFLRAFKSKYGISPGSMRKLHTSDTTA